MRFSTFSYIQTNALYIWHRTCSLFLLRHRWQMWFMCKLSFIWNNCRRRVRRLLHLTAETTRWPHARGSVLVQEHTYLTGSVQHQEWFTFYTREGCIYVQIAFSVFSTGEAENTDKISDWYQFLIESEHVLLSISKYVGQICRLSLALFIVLDKKNKQFNLFCWPVFKQLVSFFKFTFVEYLCNNSYKNREPFFVMYLHLFISNMRKFEKTPKYLYNLQNTSVLEASLLASFRPCYAKVNINIQWGCRLTEKRWILRNTQMSRVKVICYA